MSINLRLTLWLILLCTLGSVFYYQVRSGLTIETNILRLLPDTEVDPFAEKAFDRFSENNFKKVIFAVKSDTKETAVAGAKDLSRQLLQSQTVESLQSQLSDQEQETIGKLYFNHRFHLLSPKDKQLLQEEGAEPFIDYSIQMAYSPLSSQLIQLLPQDPYLLSYRYLQQMTDANFSKSSSEFVDDILIVYSEDYYYSIITATLDASPFDSETQERIKSMVDEFGASNTDIELLYTGAIFYAQHAAASAKSEISTIGLGSLIGVVALLIIAFRSILPLSLTLASLGVGVFAGFTIVNLTFGSIHVLTLVFGSSLVGVAVDYAFHYFATANESKKPLSTILGAITLGLVSSIIGYAALFSTPFPGLQQMALFCATGLVGAFLTVTLLFDRIPTRVNSPMWLVGLFVKQSRVSQSVSKKPIIISLLIAPVVALGLLANTDDNNDSIRQLQSIPQNLKQQEDSIQNLVSAPATNQFFVVKGESPDQVLRKLELVNKDLEHLVSAGTINGYNHIADFVPSTQHQQSNYQLIAKQTSSASMSPLLEIGLLQPQQIDDLMQTIAETKDNALPLEQWLNSPLGQRFSYLWLGKIDDQYATIITLHTIKNIPALESLADDNSQLYFINKVDKVSSLFSQYRELSLIMLAVAIAVIITLLTLKYQFIIASLIVLGPIVAASVAIIFNIAINGSFNLFSALALFLVFGIGIDYGLFYAESKHRSPFIYLAIGLSAITTFLSFGLLSLSETPAIHAFGLTMLTGILTVFLLSPILGHQIYNLKGISHEPSS